MALLSVEAALARILEGAAPLGVEQVPLARARGRTLARDLAARRTQPPFDASAMDGYAVRAADVANLPARLAVIGTAAAGHPFDGGVTAGTAVRIFTGAPVPAGADAIVIQENTTAEGATAIVREGRPSPGDIRRRGFDFREGEALLAAGRRLGARELALAAAMGYGSAPVFRRPRVAILSTGDELVLPGEPTGPGQIVASNHLAVAALCEQAGAETAFLGIARDTAESLTAHVRKTEDADLLITIGGASVGDHDLVAPVLGSLGMALDFWKIAMRPGKPLMHGRLGATRVIGLPGNPVSSIVCTRVFALPLLAALCGRAGEPFAAIDARAAVALEANGPRQHYMRATLTRTHDGVMEARPVRSQDSSLLAPLAAADALIVRPPDAPAVAAGERVGVLPLDF